MAKSSLKSTLAVSLNNYLDAGAIVAGAGKEMPVLGGAVEELNFMPDDVIAGGYGNLYVLAEREGTFVGYSDQVRYLCNQTVFKGYARYDGAPAIGEGFAMFTINTASGATEIPFAEDVVNRNDAYLTALSGTGLTLSPTFDKNVTAYTASVASSVASTTISATARTRGKVGSIKVNGTAVTGGVCTLASGKNTIEVEAVYGTSKNVYTIIVTKG